MATINDTYINALLADASYVSDLDRTTSPGELASALTGRMTPELAKYVSDNFTVVTQASGFASSFEATVWRGNAGTPYAGQIYVSTRGTQEVMDFAADEDLATSGLAHQQLADMVNWWLRETTEPGQMAKQIAISYVPIPGLPPLQNFVAAPDVQGTGSLVGIGAIQSVNGHSLGGYLASAFVRLFGHQQPSIEINTFNSAGFSRVAALNIENGFSQIAQVIGTGLGLGGFSSAQNNYFAQNGINFTTNTWDPVGFQQYGTRIGLFQEDLTPRGINNHYMYKLTDMLALGDALAKLDPMFDLIKLSGLVTAGSNQMVASYEGVLDSLRRILLGADLTSTVQGDANADNTGPQPTARLDYQKNLKALTDSAAFQALAGNVSITPAAGDSTLPDRAKSDFTALLSLLTLSPVQIKAMSNTAAIEAALGSAWSGAYSQWSADKSLTTVQRAQGLAYYTDTYLLDRQAMLQWVMTQNLKDQNSSSVILGQPVPTTFTDVASNRSVLIGAVNNDQRIQVIFDDEGSNTIGGYAKNDRLYGGAGADTINGLGGADYLEGNADNDQLNGGDGADTQLGGNGNDALDGGAGNDTLLGGSGDDTLTGGADDQAADTLQGGTGVDTYRFSGHWGKETIEDSDGQGLIEVDGQVLQAGLKQSDGVYRSADGNITYTEMAGADGAVDLLVSFKDKSDIITVRNWRTQAAPGNNLGIGLNEAQPPAPPAPLIGDYAKLTNGNTYTLDPHGYASTGPQAGAQDILVAGDDGANLSGLGGNDALQGGDGDDSLVGGEGDDLLLGGYGRDTLIGGAGNDFIFGSAMGSVQRPTNVNFTPPQVASGATEVARGFSWVAGRTNGQRWSQDGNDATFLDVEITGADVSTGFLGADGQIYVESLGNVIDAGAGDDFVDAGQGADVVHAGDGDDDVYGMGGADVLFGDAGSDFIMGDGVATAGQGNTTPDTLHGGDIIVGGAGRDVLLGQGGDDALYGGTEGDMLWGDDPDLVDTPLTVHGNDLLDGGDGDDRLRQKLDVELAAAVRKPRAIRLGVAI